MCSELSWCFNNSEFSLRFQRAIDAVKEEELSDLNKILLKKRFIPMVGTMEIEAKRANFLYTICQTATTLGSIMVPALLSIEDQSIIFNSTALQQSQQQHSMYWTTWGISLMVTISNAFTQLIGLEKKYIMRNIHVSQMKKEGWSFLQRSGDIYGLDREKTHDKLIHIFFKRTENLRHEQIVNDLSFDKFDNLDDGDDIELVKVMSSNDTKTETLKNKEITENTISVSGLETINQDNNQDNNQDAGDEENQENIDMSINEHVESSI